MASPSNSLAVTVLSHSEGEPVSVRCIPFAIHSFLCVTKERGEGSGMGHVSYQTHDNSSRGGAHRPVNTIFEGRRSDSPHIEMVWRGRTEDNYAPVCPADVRWNFLFMWENGKVKVSAEGPTTKSVLKYQPEAREFLVIKFKLGAYMPYLPVSDLVDGDANLPEGTGKSFWLNGSVWEVPTFDNVETFVDRMVRDGLLVHDPVVNAVMQNQSPAFSDRTVRRRFLWATGLTPKIIQQIERAKYAAELLEQGSSILDVTYQTGYADQPHLTRSLKRFYGSTPTQIIGETAALAAEAT
jgi:hypothetical protein